MGATKAFSLTLKGGFKKFIDCAGQHFGEVPLGPPGGNPKIKKKPGNGPQAMMCVGEDLKTRVLATKNW